MIQNTQDQRRRPLTKLHPQTASRVRCIRWFYDAQETVMAMLRWDGEPLDCPECGAELDEIGCEKTTVCDECDSEWRYGDGMESLVRVEEGDSVYWDR